MSENVYTIPGLISHVTQEVKQSPTPNQLRLAVTFPDRLMLSSNEQIGVFMDFAACIPDTIATSGITAILMIFKHGYDKTATSSDPT